MPGNGSAAEDGTHEDPEHVENKKAVVRQKINILNDTKCKYCR